MAVICPPIREPDLWNSCIRLSECPRLRFPDAEPESFPSFCDLVQIRVDTPSQPDAVVYRRLVEHAPLLHDGIQ